MASENVQILYQHPHITLYLEDNTIQSTESSVESDSGLYGIQVGAFESGRDNVVLRYTNTEQMISELGNLNYEVYGQAGYNAYNALNSKSCGMYIMRCMPDDATYANKVIMSKFKVLNSTKEDDPTIEHVDTRVELVAGKNAFSDMGSSALGNFSFYGKVASGLTGDASVDGLFNHITPDWLNGKDLPKFTIATIRVMVPNGVTPGETVKITQISKALKSFYADFNEDAQNIVASGSTATKTKEYETEALLPSGSLNFDLSVLVQENDTISLTVEWNDDGVTESNYTFNSANVEFVDAISTLAEEEAGTETPVDDKTRLEISYYATSFENVTTEDELRLKFAALFSENIDEEGYYHMPVMLISSLGRGSYGDNLRVKFSDAMEYDGDSTPFHRYCVTVMQLGKDGLKAKEYIRGSINETAWDNTQYADGLPAFLQDLTNDVEYGSQKISLDICAQTFEKMLALYNEEIADGEEIELLTMDTFDPIFGLDMTGEANDNILICNYTGDYEAVNLEALDGFGLSNGSDGSMTYKPKMTAEEKAVYDEAYETALIRAFQPIPTCTVVGGIEQTLPIHDKMLRSRYSTPADFMFDANFPNTVKVAMANFAKERQYDCMTYLDSGLCQTTAECISWLKSMREVYAYNVVKELHCYKYRDVKFTRKVIPMTITHFLASALPYHLSTFGLSVPFARKYARLSSGTHYIAGSFYPIIDPDDNDVKKEIYKYRGNCYESIDRNTVQRSSAITTCQENSDRMEEFNEYIIHRAVRIAYAIMNSNVYNMIDEDSILAYTEHAEKQISYNLAGLVTKVTVRMNSDAADRKKSIMRLIMHIEFYTVAKYGAVEIYLDPRGSAAEAAALAAQY